MNQWDRLRDIFGGKWDQERIPEYAADNICIAWPSAIRCIERNCDVSARLNVLDFGCGGGLFCRRLCGMGFEVTGYDPAQELIKIARLNTPEDVTVTSSGTVMEQNGEYDLITSIMVFQFIEEIEATLARLVSLLKPRGLIVYAVFNPDFVEDNASGGLFKGLVNSEQGYLEIRKGIEIPVFVRSASVYRSMLEKLGCKEVCIDLPAFTDEFLAAYALPFSTRRPEYLIQAFRGAARSG